jgi:hypothetical protein
MCTKLTTLGDQDPGPYLLPTDREMSLSKVTEGCIRPNQVN